VSSPRNGRGQDSKRAPAEASAHLNVPHELSKKKPGGKPGFKFCESYAGSPLILNLCRRLTALFASFVFCLALLHQVTVLARHRVSLEPLLADFASTGIGVGGG
jgi:hypothetical protein